MPIHERVKFDLGDDFVNPFKIVRWADPTGSAWIAGLQVFGAVTGTQGTVCTIQMYGKIRF